MLKLTFLLTFVAIAVRGQDEEVGAYHFHTYFFQDNPAAKAAALAFRQLIHNEIVNGNLRDCSLNQVNYGPRGPHPIGSWETCCNKTSLEYGVSWFMQNRANNSILLHPLTR